MPHAKLNAFLPDAKRAVAQLNRLLPRPLAQRDCTHLVHTIARMLAEPSTGPKAKDLPPILEIGKQLLDLVYGVEHGRRTEVLDGEAERRGYKRRQLQNAMQVADRLLREYRLPEELFIGLSDTMLIELSRKSSAQEVRRDIQELTRRGLSVSAYKRQNRKSRTKVTAQLRAR